MIQKSGMRADLIPEFASHSIDDKVEYIKTISDEDLKSLSDWFESNVSIELHSSMISNEIERRKREKRDVKLNDLGL
jgi:hypothetical protein